MTTREKIKRVAEKSAGSSIGNLSEAWSVIDDLIGIVDELEMEIARLKNTSHTHKEST